ncbi:hypothetical protein Taro_040719 [Colocasia esculenta]|uniref:Aminotransferase-like plant mobile domain-containing protein n=1 Tax=Colocasia esculenta TaxID=4460 RepID=A0A843WVC5_COLES|nr:hypothetical protein [Colocasia esculenta]
MGFGHLLAVRLFHIDVSYLEALSERRDEDCKAFIMPWGHMIPTLEDVAYLTRLPVQGEPVVGQERRDYYNDMVELLGPEFMAERRRPIRSILLGSLSEVVGLRGGRRGALETLEEFGAGVRASIQLEGQSEDQSSPPHSSHVNWFATPVTDSDKHTQVYLSVSQPRTKGLAAAPREKVKQLWRPTKHHHLRTTRSQAHAWHLQRPWPGLARVRHWRRTSWGPVSTTGVRTPNYERATSDQKTSTTTTVPLSSFPQSDVQLKQRSEDVQVRRHRPRRYNTSTGTKPRANSLAHRKLGAPNWRGNHVMAATSTVVDEI